MPTNRPIFTSGRIEISTYSAGVANDSKTKNINIKEQLLNAEKLETILDAATRVFIQYGYQKTTMDDVAREAMIGKGTIYHYFSSKEDIFVAILKKAQTEIFEELTKKISESDSFEERLKLFFIAPYTSFMAHHKLFIQILNEDSPTFMKKIHESKAEIYELLRAILCDIFREGVASGVVNSRYTNSIEDIMNIIFKWKLIGGEHVRLNLSEENIQSIGEDYKLFVDVILYGLVEKSMPT